MKKPRLKITDVFGKGVALHTVNDTTATLRFFKGPNLEVTVRENAVFFYDTRRPETYAFYIDLEEGEVRPRIEQPASDGWTFIRHTAKPVAEIAGKVLASALLVPGEDRLELRVEHGKTRVLLEVEFEGVKDAK